MNIRKKISRWYQGEPIKNPHMRLVGFYDRPWIAEKADRTILFIKKERKWVIGSLIAIISLTKGL